MSKTVHSVKLVAYDSVDLDRVSYAKGDVVFDVTNNTLRLMDGVNRGGTKMATQSWVTANTINAGNLNSSIASQLVGYDTITARNSAITTALVPYATTTALNTAIASINTNTYSLPTASTGTLGGVKIDGTTITINGSGVISSASAYSLPIAQAATGGNTLGGVIPDGVTITINPTTGVITGANTYVLPSATTSVKGGVIIPAVATSGITNTSGTIGLATASASQLGGVKVDGSTITIASGVISAPYTYTLPAATTGSLGGVIVPITANSGLTNSSGTIRLVQATTTQLGGVKVDGTTITISPGGQISAVFAGAITFVGAWSAAANSPTLTNGTGTNGNEYLCSVAGTVNFGSGNITFAVGDAVIYNGTTNQWIRIPASASLSNLTFATSGGVSSGSTYNGISAVTIDYSSIGASPLAGSSSLTTVGTIGSGTWNGSVIGANYGGTGVANGTNTITLGGNITTAGAFTTSGAYGLTLTATALTNATLPAGTVTLAANNQVHYIGTTSVAINRASANLALTGITSVAMPGSSSGTSTLQPQAVAGTTTFTLPSATGTLVGTGDTGSVTNTMLANSSFYIGTTSVSLGAASGSITSLSVNISGTAGAATNVAGGVANQIVYQTGTGSSSFITAPASANTYLKWTGSAFSWTTVAAGTGTVTSVSGTGTVSGLTLTGTVTSSGSLTLGGTLSLSVFNAAGAFSTLSASSTLTASLQAGTTSGSGSIYISNATNGRIDFIAGAYAAPTFTSTSTGAKIVLYPQVGASSADYAIGIAGNTLWNGVPQTAQQFQWYGGTTVAATLSGAGSLTVNGSLGYPTGSSVGGAVTQTGTRTAGVTINKITGQITLVSAAGSATLTSFTVTNSTVTATDVVVVSVGSATNYYNVNVTYTSAGSFTIGFLSLSGTSVDTPVINFAVIKGSNN